MGRKGFDKLMPENRSFPWKYIPRLGVKLSITFGDPLSPQDIQAALQGLSHEHGHHHSSSSQALSKTVEGDDGVDGEDRLFGVDCAERVREGVTRESISTNLEHEDRKRKIDHVRSMVTAVVQGGVEAVGRRISGDMLGKKADV